jgi:hypothetical protein
MTVLPVSTYPSGAQLATNAQAAADASGRFTIRDVFPGRYRVVATSGHRAGRRTVPPGDYRLATFLDAEPGAWFDPAFLDALGTASIRVSLGDGEKKVQNLRVSDAH